MSAKHKKFGATIKNFLDKTYIHAPLRTQIGILFFSTFALTVFGAVIAILTTDVESPRTALWWTWRRIMDPGSLQEDKGLWTKILSSSIVILGWLIFGGAVISIMTTTLQRWLESLRKGLKEISCSDHTVILGWNSTVFSVIDQLSCTDTCRTNDIVVMSDLNVEKMEEECQRYCKSRFRKKVIFRRGAIESTERIRNLNIHEAKEIIILGYDLESETILHATQSPIRYKDIEQLEDAHILKTILACYLAYSAPDDEFAPELEIKQPISVRKIPVVVAVDSHYSAVMIEKGLPKHVKNYLDVYVIGAVDFLTRLIAQSIIAPEVLSVFEDLLSYEMSSDDKATAAGAEIYFADVPIDRSVTKFDQLLFSYPEAIPFGLIYSGGRHILNPHPGLELPSSEDGSRAGCRVVLVANDSAGADKYDKAAAADPPLSIQEKIHEQEDVKHVLLSGHGQKEKLVLRHLEDFLPDGSHVYADQPHELTNRNPNIAYHHVSKLFEDAALCGQTESIKAGTSVGSIDIPWTLLTDVILLDDHVDRDRHDANVFMQLTYIIKIMNDLRETDAIPEDSESLQFIVELLDARNRIVAKSFGNTVEIISSEFVSNYLVQIAQQPERKMIFEELFTMMGNEVAIYAAKDYFPHGKEKTSFKEIMKCARLNGEIAIGYFNPKLKPALHLNPTGKNRNIAKTPDEFGKIAVIAPSIKHGG